MGSLADRDEDEDRIQGERGQQEQPRRPAAGPNANGPAWCRPFGTLGQGLSRPTGRRVIVWDTYSGVPVPANSVATASLMTAPVSGVVAWSR